MKNIEASGFSLGIDFLSQGKDTGTQGRRGTWQRAPFTATCPHPFATTQAHREHLQLISVSPFARLCHCSALHPGLHACLSFLLTSSSSAFAGTLPPDAVAVPVFSQPEAVVPCAGLGLGKTENKGQQQQQKDNDITKINSWRWSASEITKQTLQIARSASRTVKQGCAARATASLAPHRETISWGTSCFSSVNQG